MNIKESTGYYHSFFRNEKSKDLLVVFSHLGRRPPKFAWFKVLQSIQINLLFVNCEGEEWYRDGIKGLGDGGINSTLSAIKKLAASIHPKCDVFMAGGSMGGYGALLYGAILGAKAVFASSAELILGLPGGRSKGLTRGRWSHIYPDLRVVAKFPVRRHVIYGAMHLLDTLSASLYHNVPSTNIYSIDGADHAATDTLAYRNIFTDSLERMLTGDDYILDENLYPKGLAASSLIDEIWILNSLMEEKAYSKAIPLAEKLHEHHTDHPLPMFLAGVCQFKLMNLADAKFWFEKSYSHCKDYAAIPLHLGVIESREKKYPEALDYLKYSLSLNDSPSITHYQIGCVLQAHGNLDEAIQFYQKATEINPNHLGYKESLSAALKKANPTEQRRRQNAKLEQQNDPRDQENPQQ